MKYPVAECPSCHDISGEYMAGYCGNCRYHKVSPKCKCHACKKALANKRA